MNHCHGTIVQHPTTGLFTKTRSTLVQKEVEEVEQFPSLQDIISNDPNLTIFTDALQAASFFDRHDTLFFCTSSTTSTSSSTTDCNSTIFAPTNDAFAKLEDHYLTMLLSPPWILHLRNLLTLHHTIPNKNGLRILSNDFVDGQEIQMRNNEFITINDMKRGITVSTPNTELSNLVEVDLLASDGVIQKVDTILFPLFVGMDVFALGTYYSHNEFQILTPLLESIGLVGIRSEFTLLAPIDAAFVALDSDVFHALHQDQVLLRNVLVNHVIYGVHPTVWITDGLVLNSLAGRNITFTISDDMNNTDAIVTLPSRNTDFSASPKPPFQVNGINILVCDVLANNGIAHVIDQLLFDPSLFTNAPTKAPK